MKKLFTLLMLVVAGVCAIMAQTNYRDVFGYVIDKNGNPIVGAEVIATGGGESALTDADGSFRLSVHPYLKSLTASYAGFQNKTLKTRFGTDMIFTLKPQNMHPGFLNVLGGVNINDYEAMGNLGLMGGQLGNWGWYAKGTMTIYDAGVSAFTITGGVIKNLYRMKSFLYLGAGFGRSVHDSYYYYGYDEYDYADGVAFDLGYMFRPSKHFNINIGLTIPTDFDNVNFIPQVGVGYVF